ncbi:MAG: hypothetical protein ACI97A_004305 [Planctomycetota bacterium]|jgi:hypothetical protein
MSNCPPASSLVDAVESGVMDPELDDHIELCAACRSMISSLREEAEGLTISVGDLWVKERISCPHRDILLAYVNKSLTAPEMDFIDFHLETVECPYCQADATELADLMTQESSKNLEDALEKSLRRSAADLASYRQKE